MAVARSGPGVARGADGRIYITGGFTGTGATGGTLNTFVALDPTAGTFATLANMPTARAYPAFVALLDGRLMAAEGQTAATNYGINTVETYTVASNSWR